MNSLLRCYLTYIWKNTRFVGRKHRWKISRPAEKKLKLSHPSRDWWLFLVSDLGLLTSWWSLKQTKSIWERTLQYDNRYIYHEFSTKLYPELLQPFTRMTLHSLQNKTFFWPVKEITQILFLWLANCMLS